MADQPDNNDDVESPDTPAGQDQHAEAPVPPEAAQAPPAEGSDAGVEAAGEEPSGEQAVEQPAGEQPSESAAAPGSGAGPQAGEAPAAQLPPKERRAKTRSTHTGKARPPRSPEERHAERLAARKDKAARRRGLRLKERAKAASRRSAGGQAAPGHALADVHPRAEGTRKVRQGIVVSDKADKSITVRIDVARRHRRYEKIVRSSSTLHAHDENNDAHQGDTVRVIESRPLSRTKRWRLVEVLERAR